MILWVPFILIVFSLGYLSGHRSISKKASLIFDVLLSITLANFCAFGGKIRGLLSQLGKLDNLIPLENINDKLYDIILDKLINRKITAHEDHSVSDKMEESEKLYFRTLSNLLDI